MKNRLTMKSIISILIAGIFLSLSAIAQDFTVTVYGNVWRTSTNTIVPVPDQEVIITIDSSANGFYYQNSVYTDQEGYYEDVVSIPDSAIFGYVQAQTFDSCLSQYQYDGQPIIPGATLTPMDFYICSNYPPECQAFFSYFPMDPANGLSYSFLNQSTGNVLQFYWDFGDSTYSSEENPVHTFPGPGLYDVCLTISCDNGCTSSFCDWVNAGSGTGDCENYFIYSYTDQLFTLNFEGFMYSDLPPISYWWDFGDGTTGEGQTVTHTYDPGPGYIGIYMVSLTTVVVDSNYDSCFYTSYQEVWLQNNPPGCFASFFYYPDSVDMTTIYFQDMSYTGNDSPPDTWSWEFGDGTGSTEQNPVHTYADTGFYSVCLTITDSMGMCTDTYCEEVFTGYLPPPMGCSSYFTYQQDDSLTYTFNGMVSTNNDTVYPGDAEYLWDFGDGTTGSGQTVTHTFQENPAGGYTVCLTASIMLPNGNLCSSVYCEYIFAGPNTFYVFGSVILGDNLMADQATVRLMTLDTLWQGAIELESTTVDSMGQYYFPDIPLYDSRLYFVQAELSENSAWYGQFVPTYHLNSLTWEEAFPILPPMNGPADIWMIPAGQTDSGDGSITGVVTDLGTRGFLDNIEVVLLDENENPLVYSRSDSQGNFAFENLPMGTYIVHAEIVGIHTVESPVTLSTEQPGANVEIQVSGGEANIVFGVPDLHISLEKVGDIYPNPVNTEARMDITIKETATVTVAIYSQTGQLVSEKEISLGTGSHTLKLDIGDLTPGIYMLRLTTGQGDMVGRKFMKNR